MTQKSAALTDRTSSSRSFSYTKFQRDLVLLGCLSACVFLLFSLIGFDPLGPWLLSSAALEVSSNMAGLQGNLLAGLLIYSMGIAAWLMPFFLLHLLFSLKRDFTFKLTAVLVMSWFFLLCSCSMFLTKFFPFYEIKSISFSSGGILGLWALNLIQRNVGAVGFWIFVSISIFTFVLLLFRKTTDDLSSLLKVFLLSKKTAPNTSEFSTEVSTGTKDDEKTMSLMDREISADPQPSKDDDSDEHGLGMSFFTKAAIDAKDKAIELWQQNSSLSLGSQTWADSEFAVKNNYQRPPISIFKTTDESILNPLSQKELETTSVLLTRTFEDFGVTGKIIGWQPGPVVTVYEFQPDAGVKQSRILGLIDDIALSLKVDSIFIHPVTGKRAMGIQVPNTKRESVLLGDILTSDVFEKSPSPLTFAMGKTINGTPFAADLTSMPHLLAAGATGTGKSVAINSLLCSIIMKSSPEDVRMILVDPKMLELSVYDGIPHLLMPVITEPDRASNALKWAANEMERRYKLMQHAQVRNIAGFNLFWDQADQEKKTHLRSLMNDDQIERLPYILLVIDELADLMLTAPKDVESSIQRLAQKARASGIHMVLATQRPSVDVITGVIKANLPCRLSFQVVSKHDSRTILDQIGSEKLLGKGDILLQRPGIGRLERLQGALVTDEEVLSLVAKVKELARSSYDERAMSWIDDELTKSQPESSLVDGSLSIDSEPKWDEAISIAKAHGAISASFLQRQLKIGYNRAARIVEAMEAQGLVAKADGVKPRKWIGSQT